MGTACSARVRPAIGVSRCRSPAPPVRRPPAPDQSRTRRRARVATSIVPVSKTSWLVEPRCTYSAAPSSFSATTRVSSGPGPPPGSPSPAPPATPRHRGPRPAYRRSDHLAADCGRCPAGTVHGPAPPRRPAWPGARRSRRPQPRRGFRRVPGRAAPCRSGVVPAGFIRGHHATPMVLEPAGPGGPCRRSRRPGPGPERGDRLGVAEGHRVDAGADARRRHPVHGLRRHPVGEPPRMHLALRVDDPVRALGDGQPAGLVPGALGAGDRISSTPARCRSGSAAADRRYAACPARAAGPRSAPTPVTAGPVRRRRRRRTRGSTVQPHLACRGQRRPASRPRSARSSPRSGRRAGRSTGRRSSRCTSPPGRRGSEAPSSPPWSTASRTSLRRSRSTSRAAFSGPLTLPGPGLGHVAGQIAEQPGPELLAVGEVPPVVRPLQRLPVPAVGRVDTVGVQQCRAPRAPRRRPGSVRQRRALRRAALRC